jgi:hypothetical protein
MNPLAVVTGFVPLVLFAFLDLVGLVSAALGRTMSELLSSVLQWAPTVVMVVIAVRYTNRTVT